LTLSISAILLYSCGKDSKCGKSTGEIQTFTRDLAAFEKMNVYDKIQLELKPSSVNRATITCGKNLVDFIITENQGNELTIRNENKCDFLRSYKKEIKIVLEFTSLSKINFVGAGNVTCTDTIKQSYFEVIGEGCSGDFNLLVNTDSIRFTLATGNSNVNLSGKTNLAYFYSGGTSIIDASKMAAKVCLANNSGTGDFKLNAIDYLYAQIEEFGNIYYSGNPSVDKKGSGRGQLIHQ
jgi:Putative auto-transporter adhesin, head GIN domain